MRTFLFNVVLLFLLFGVAGKAQISDKARVTQYYSLINKAEISICQGNLLRAAECYRKAYAMAGPNMTSKSLYNYLLVCADLGLYKEAVSPIVILKQRGWQNTLFEEIIYDNYKRTAAQRLYALFENGKDENLIPQLDTFYRNALLSCVALDQNMNRYLRSLNGGNFNSETEESFRQITGGNLLILGKMFANYFPSDAIIGSKWPQGNPIYDVILIHNAQGYKDHILDTVLYRGVLSLQLEPSVFEYIMSMYQRENGPDTASVFYQGVNLNTALFPYDFIVARDSLFEFQVTKQQVEACTKARKNIIGLCTLEEQRQKIIYQYYHPGKFRFITHRYITFLDIDVRNWKIKFVPPPTQD